MPYNTSAIPPRQEPTGETSLPLSKVKKIIAQDRDVEKCSTNAAFIICVATEMFIQHLSKKAHNNARSERKPRRNIQYQDVANAVAHHDHLQFLEDIVPRAVPYKMVKTAAAAKRAQLAAGTKASPGNKEALAGSGAGRTKAKDGQAKLLINGDVALSLQENGPAREAEEDVEMDE